MQIRNVAGQASTLNQLGNLYDVSFGRPEEAVAFYLQAADKYVELHDLAEEGRSRYNIADTLRKLNRLADARREILRAIGCDAHFGHASESWKTWNLLAAIETDSGDSAAAAAAQAKAKAKAKAIASYLAYRRGFVAAPGLRCRTGFGPARSLYPSSRGGVRRR